MTGGCACGRIRYSAEVEGATASLCHCRMCQRSSGNVSLALTTLDKAGVRWEREPNWYESSPIARRPFCSACGASLGFAYNDSDKIDLTVASFDDPSRFRPQYHFGTESAHRAWLNTEGLPETRTEDYQPLVDRWTKATGEFPG